MATPSQNYRLQLFDAILFGLYLLTIVLVSVLNTLPLSRLQYLLLLVTLTLGRAGLLFFTDLPALRRRIVMGTLLSAIIIYLVYSQYAPAE